MDELKKSIDQHNLDQKLRVDSLGIIDSLEELIKASPIGTVREWKSGKWIKTAQGWEKLREVRGQKESVEKEEVKDKDGKELKNIKPGDGISTPFGKLRVKEVKDNHVVGVSDTNTTYNILSHQIEKVEKVDSGKETITNTAKVKPGEKTAAFGIGGDRSKMINWPSTKKIQTAEGQKEAEEALTQMSIHGRSRVLNAYQKEIDNDKKKVKWYQEISEPHIVQSFIDKARDKYIGDTNIKEGKTSIHIDSKDNFTINGSKVYVDKDSSYVKLGSPGRGSSVGGFYGGGHFEGQLQGSSYVHLTDSLINELRETGSVKTAVSNTQKGLKSESNQKDFEELIRHLKL